MGEKYRMTSSFLDGFKASFTPKECILAGQSYPLGYFIIEYLEVDRGLFRALDRLVPIFKEELTVFLSARDPSSAATAQQALNAVWDVLIQLPLYRHLGRHGGNVRWLLRDMKEHPELVDEMLTPGTGRNAMLHEWLNRLENLSPSVEGFVRNTEWMLENYFKDLPSRKPEDYAVAFEKYRLDIEGEHQMLMDERENDDSIPEPDLPQISFPNTGIVLSCARPR